MNAPGHLRRLSLGGLVLLLGGCAGHSTVEWYIPIEGKGTQSVKVARAKRVLAAFPEVQIREQIQKRFPQLSDTQLKRIHLSYLSSLEEHEEPPPLYYVEPQVYLVMEIEEDAWLRPIEGEIKEFVASLFRAELQRERRS